MEKIKLQSNRKWIFITILPGAIIILAVILLILVMLIVDFETTRNLGIPIVLLYILIPAECVYIAILLVTKYKKGMSYVFYADRIEIYKKNIFQYAINVSDIDTMNYYPFRFHYILTIYAGALPEGGAWKIHIATSDHEKHSLGYISQHDARKIKEIYPHLMKIMYDKKDQTTND
ncbi:MAG: hypothetical protein LKE36_06065 [Bacilli bacterium]|jgi:hypothetical protein|nr:hypothetical protein [Bacilli bacterium]